MKTNPESSSPRQGRSTRSIVTRPDAEGSEIVLDNGQLPRGAVDHEHPLGSLQRFTRLGYLTSNGQANAAEPEEATFEISTLGRW